MEPRRDRPGWLPAEREPDGLPVPAAPSATAGWRRVVRSPQGAAGLAVLAAALLLWPFADWAVIPWLIGLAVLVVLHLVRLDGLLRGWAPHVSGVAVVVGLMYSTTPWAWALAASIGGVASGVGSAAPVEGGGGRGSALPRHRRRFRPVAVPHAGGAGR